MKPNFKIHPDMKKFLSENPKMYDILEIFSKDFEENYESWFFEVTFGFQVQRKNQPIECYIIFLKPNDNLMQLFGFEREILLLYSDSYTWYQNNLIFIEDTIKDEKYQLRIDNRNVIVICNDINFKKIIEDHKRFNDYARNLIPFTRSECILNKNFSSFVIRRFTEYLFDRNLFDFTDPIKTDNLFFGRNTFVNEVLDCISSSQNIGIFGLRRSGKTSIILKIQRLIEKLNKGKMIYLSMEDPEFYQLRWWELLDKLGNMLSSTSYNSASSNEAVINFSEICKEYENKSIKVIIAIDEVEHMSIYQPLREHWKNDFIEFWKSMRSLRSKRNNVSFIIAGVNSSVSENPTYNGIDNPLFNFIKVRYVNFFNIKEIEEMLSCLGRMMGIIFKNDVFEYLKENFGGHPLLIRQISGVVYNNVKTELESWPMVIDKKDFVKIEESHIRPILWPFFKQILELLKNWYKNELYLLYLITISDTNEINRLNSQNPCYLNHLRQYQLIKDDLSFSIPLIKLFIENNINYKSSTIENQLEKQVTKSTASEKDIKHADILAEINKNRNLLELKLRRLIRKTFVLNPSLGLKRWTEPVKKAITQERVANLSNITDEKLLESLYFNELQKVLISNWEYFRFLETHTQKNHLDYLMTEINKNRVDAHAKNITDEDQKKIIFYINDVIKVINNFDYD